jgi:hypothetical protein
MANKKPQDPKPVKHVEATRPEPWPGIKGRSRDHEGEPETGSRRADPADVTEAQRKLEKDVEGEDEPTRE